MSSKIERIKDCKYVDKNGHKCQRDGGITKGYCKTHYSRLMRHGDVDFESRIYGEDRIKNPLYNTWRNIRERCYNKDRKDYKDYGGRGIKMSDEWLNFSSFCLSVGKKPTSRHSVERKDVNGDYCKENFKWATPHEQAANKRNNNKTVGVGYDKFNNVWIASLKIDKIRPTKTFKTEHQAMVYRKELEEKHLLFK